MNLEQVLERFKNKEDINSNITEWVEIPEKPGSYKDFPDWIDYRIRDVMEQRGIRRLYSHQADAIEEIHKGKNVVVVTPTASGKTLCYNVPVLDAILKNNESRALFLFPTKALSQDQLNELYGLIKDTGTNIKTFTYDGDTPRSARKTIRQAGHIVVTNPDMLHGGILPNHTKWTGLFENLNYVVIDEIHHYRGVFGSHVANVIRRLKRICNFYGANPQFICCSATIANPLELTEKITGSKAVLVDNNGAPAGGKHIIFYNPPVINSELGIRKSSIMEARKFSVEFIANKIRTIIFTRSRLNTEILVTYLKDTIKRKGNANKCIRGYRGGYLPELRREIEKGLKEGTITGVVSTNALELGIDIGSLEACIICGYPGTIASTWQQAGRAGRRSNVSVALFIASSSPLDQFIVTNPEYFFGNTPENGLINPDNFDILYNHVKCAAFELPFDEGEIFGVDTTAEILSYMEEVRLVRHVGKRWHWMSEIFPASEINLRTASNENFVIIDISEPSHKSIGEIDRFSAPMIIHEEAIYMHEGQQYQIEKLDFKNKKAYARKVSVDYYTDAKLSVELKVLDVFRNKEQGVIQKSFGEVRVSCIVTMFKKIKLYTHENIGSGPVNLPELNMHTTSYWVSFSKGITSDMSERDVKNALTGLSNILANAAPVFLMCDPRDIKVVYEVRSSFSKRPAIYIYDSYPGGVGFGNKLFELHEELFLLAYRMIKNCSCEYGCPSCVGPLNEFSDEINPKELTLILLERIIDTKKNKKKKHRKLRKR